MPFHDLAAEGLVEPTSGMILFKNKQVHWPIGSLRHNPLDSVLEQQATYSLAFIFGSHMNVIQTSTPH